MEKYTQAIIEIVLEHVTCLHQIQEEYPRGPKQNDVTYGIEKEQELIKKCLELKPEATEEFIAEKAKLFVYAIMPSEVEPTRSDIHAAKEFLRTLFKEME